MEPQFQFLFVITSFIRKNSIKFDKFQFLFVITERNNLPRVDVNVLVSFRYYSRAIRIQRSLHRFSFFSLLQAVNKGGRKNAYCFSFFSLLLILIGIVLLPVMFQFLFVITIITSQNPIFPFTVLVSFRYYFDFEQPVYSVLSFQFLFVITSCCRTRVTY